MFKKIMTIVLALCMALSVLVGCNTADPNAIEFVVYGSQSELATYTKMVNAFNAGYGKEHNIKVNMSVKPSGNYTQYVQYTASSKSGPDVFLIVEDNFKGYVNAGMMGDITAEMNAVTDIDVSDIYPIMTNRLRYNIQNNTSSSDDPIYGLPIDTKPTALYYNESMFEKAGIVVISVDEEDLDAWNAGTKADNRGKTKAQYIQEYTQTYETYAGLYAQLADIEVPAKGYYRSLTPYTPESGAWQKPASDEVLVFNNRIAMNWDEVEDLAMLFSGSTNPDPAKVTESSPPSVYGSTYGYFTEWWFNYGWSVGGDCLEDLTGNGDWNFSLLDPNPNYVVREGKTYTGAYTGKTYTAGETIEFVDKLNIPAGELLVADSVGGYTYQGNVVSTRPEILSCALTIAQQKTIASGGTVDGADDKILAELPSTREAFTRYLKLGAKKTANIDNEGGLDVAINPNQISGAKP